MLPYCALVRTIAAATYSTTDDLLQSAYATVLRRLRELSKHYVDCFKAIWEPSRDLASTHDIDIHTYLIHCARFMEAVGVAYFTTGESSDQATLATLLIDFVQGEPGCGRPISDRNAVSIVIATLALLNSGNDDSACNLITEAVVWVCDRYEQGIGLASCEADEAEEVFSLLGYAFDFIKSPQGRSSFLATALSDLAALAGNDQLYADVVNDFKAVDVVPQYWQPNDSAGACFIEASDVIQHPSVAFDDSKESLDRYAYADHVRTEPRTFHFADTLGPVSALAIMMLIRDRYFPTLWKAIAH